MTSGPPLMQIREKRNWDARVSTRQRLGAQFASEQFANEWFLLVVDRLGRGKSVTEAQGEAFQGVATDADSDDSQMELVPARVCRRSREETSLRIPDSIVDGAPIPVASE